jgi:toxin-antitoxin system PIN domain toxin
MFVVDTNILLYAVNPDALEHDRAHALLEEWRSDERPWFLTWGIVYEFIRVATHHSVFPSPLSIGQAREWLGILMSGRPDAVLVATDRHMGILTELVSSHPRLRGNPVHDLHIAALMMEHGVPEIRTADTDFHQFGFLRVVNPLDSE